MYVNYQMFINTNYVHISVTDLLDFVNVKL